jgi:hypothetical protein
MELGWTNLNLEESLDGFVVGFGRVRILRRLFVDLLSGQKIGVKRYQSLTQEELLRLLGE